MSKKPAQEINQLSFLIDSPQSSCSTSSASADATEFTPISATIIPFPGSSNAETSAFRRRVMRDLIRNHLIVD